MFHKPIDPYDADFIKNIKDLLGIDAKNVEVLLPKLSPSVLIDLAGAINNRDKPEALQLIKDGRLSEDQILAKAKAKDKKEKKKLLDMRESDFNVGDAVEANGQEATVKIINGPSNTIGVMIKGRLEMVDKKDVSKLDEGVMGMTSMPDLQRMQKLAGILSIRNDGEDDFEHNTEGLSTMNVEPVMTSSTDECGASALALLDELSTMLPNLRLSDIKAVRKRMLDISNQINESTNYTRSSLASPRRLK